VEGRRFMTRRAVVSGFVSDVVKRLSRGYILFKHSRISLRLKEEILDERSQDFAL